MRLVALTLAALLIPSLAASAPAQAASTTAVPAAATDRAAFVRDFRRDFPAVRLSDKQVLAAADATVKDLRAGLTWNQVRSTMPKRMPGADPTMALSLVQGLLLPGFTPRQG